jgi:hypothetical protein
MLRTVQLPALGLLVVIAPLGASCSHATEPVASPPPQATTAAAGAQDPLLAFETVRAVLQHPRCENCHPPGNAPLQGDEGRVHDQLVQRGPDGRGLPGAQCSTCHGQANLPDSYGPHQPPGVSSEWHLPPPEMKMVFVGLSSPALCEQLKDPARNGHKDLAALVKHVSTDPLVLWAWAPGFGRRPVRISHADFVAAFKRWTDAGAPCPTASAAPR